MLGWCILGVLGVNIGFNVIILTFVYCKSSCRTCKITYLKVKQKEKVLVYQKEQSKKNVNKLIGLDDIIEVPES